MPQKPNGFFFYMRTMKQENAAWKYKGYPELSGLCSEGWNSLSKEEKQFYEDMKHDYDGFVKPKKKKKKSKAPGEVDERGLDCLGRPILSIMGAVRDEKEAALTQRRDIKEMVKCSRNILNEEFYLVYSTNYCITKRDPIVHVPAEITIGKFNVRRGFLQTVFHSFISPEVPLGYKLAIQDNCERVLKIPFDFDVARPIDHVLKSLNLVEDEILKSQRGTSRVTLFCHEDDLDVCRKNLEKICEPEGVSFQVYPLAELVLALITAGNVAFDGFTSSAIALLIHHQKRDIEFGLDCDWHEQNSDLGLCSTRVIKKWCRSITDFLHPLLDVHPPKH